MRPRSPRWVRWLAAAGIVAAVAVCVAVMLRSPARVGPPLPTTTETALQAEKVATRTALRFAPNPAIVVLDFPNLAEQGHMLNRLAAWAEKVGVPHDRVLNDTELAAAIAASGATNDNYYYGHDYRAADIARFFQLSDQHNIKLNPDEETLRRFTQKTAAEPFGFGALITIPHVDAANGIDDSVRYVILHHELSHGEYFTNATYAAFVHTVWASVLTATERAAFRSYLTTQGYDPSLEDLMVNEMQAYLMHTPDPRFFDPSQLGIPPARLSEIRKSFLGRMPSCWLRDETALPP